MIYGMTDDEIVEHIDAMGDQINGLEAKLAKAVETLNALDATLARDSWPFASIAREDIRTTLAKIKGTIYD